MRILALDLGVITPYILSVITIYSMFLAGNKTPVAWLVALLNQILWLMWIAMTKTWGFLPMNIALWVVYSRNYLMWKRSPS